LAISLALAILACGCTTARFRKEAPEPPPLPAPTASDAEPPPPLAVVDATPHVPTILLLGDSHSYGAFGYRLHVHLASNGQYAVISEAAGGATTETYLEAQPEAGVGYRVRESARGENVPREVVSRIKSPIDRLDDLLEAHDPEVVVIALGTNRPRLPVTESATTLLQRLMRDRPLRRVFWIGPPAVGPDRTQAIVASLRSAIDKYPTALFIDSTSFNAKDPLPPENPHFSPDDARRWADTAFAQIGPKLSP